MLDFGAEKHKKKRPTQGNADCPSESEEVAGFLLTTVAASMDCRNFSMLTQPWPLPVPGRSKVWLVSVDIFVLLTWAVVGSAIRNFWW